MAFCSCLLKAAILMFGLFHTNPKQTILKFQLLLILRNSDIIIVTPFPGKETSEVRVGAKGRLRMGRHPDTIWHTNYRYQEACIYQTHFKKGHQSFLTKATIHSLIIYMNELSMYQILISLLKL